MSLLTIAVMATMWLVIRSPVAPVHSGLVVDDVSQLNPIRVSRVLTPTATEEIVAAVRTQAGPVSIGGARHSMGGQIATEGGLHLDMRRFNKILDFAPARKTITVQSGATWRQVQEVIDRADLSIRIMQSYADFTVGGSLSVNGHGRYVGAGPLINGVKSFRLVLACSRNTSCRSSDSMSSFPGCDGCFGSTT